MTALDRTEGSGVEISVAFSLSDVWIRVEISPKKMLRPRQRAVEFGITPGVRSLGEIYFVIEIFNTSHREKILLRSNFPDNVRMRRKMNGDDDSKRSNRVINFIIGLKNSLFCVQNIQKTGYCLQLVL